MIFNEILTHLLERSSIFGLFWNRRFKYFERERPDLVLLDIMLPGKNGDQVLREIQHALILMYR